MESSCRQRPLVPYIYCWSFCWTKIPHYHAIPVSYTWVMEYYVTLSMALKVSVVAGRVWNILSPSIRFTAWLTSNFLKARYTLATKLNSTRSTLLNFVDGVTLARTHWRQSRPYRQRNRPSWRQCRLRQAVEFKLLPICRQNRQQSWPYRR